MASGHYLCKEDGHGGVLSEFLFLDIDSLAWLALQFVFKLKIFLQKVKYTVFLTGGHSNNF